LTKSIFSNSSHLEWRVELSTVCELFLYQQYRMKEVLLYSVKNLLILFIKKKTVQGSDIYRIDKYHRNVNCNNILVEWAQTIVATIQCKTKDIIWSTFCTVYTRMHQ